MEPLTIALMVVVLMLGVWANGSFQAVPAEGPAPTVEAPAAWFVPLGVLALALVAGLTTFLVYG